MNKTQGVGIGLLAATILIIVSGVVAFNHTNKPATTGATASIPTREAPVVPAAVASNDPAAQPNPIRVTPGPGPLVQAETVFRPFKCVNQRTRATVFELGRARNAQFMGQRNNRSFWKVDTPTRTVTFNTDVRDVNCAFTGQ